MKECRKSLRFQCNELVTVHFRKRTYEGRVTDVSQGGLKLQTEQYIPTGSAVWLEPAKEEKPCHPIQTFARWTTLRSPYEIGLEFALSSHGQKQTWLSNLLPQDKLRSSKSQARSEVRVPASLPVFNAARPEQDGVTLDLSPSGASVLLDHKLDDCAQLFLCLPWDYLELQVDVMRVRQEDDLWLHGVKFHSLGKSERWTVREFIREFMET